MTLPVGRLARIYAGSMQYIRAEKHVHKPTPYVPFHVRMYMESQRARALVHTRV